MQRKVLMLKNNQGELMGTLSLENEGVLNGKLKVFDFDKKVCLVLKIGENFLVFGDIDSSKDFDFSTIFHDLNLPIGALVCDEGQKFFLAKTQNFLEDENVLFNYFLTNQQELKAQSNGENKGEQVFEDERDKSLSEPIENTDNFFEQIEEDFDKLFSENEHFLELEQKLENTEWVKIPYQGENSDHYLLGKVFDENKNLAYVCYGMYCKEQKSFSEVELKDYCQWLPTNGEEGYYVMYQDAKTGENLKF